jgi:hypothetical protein
MLKCGADEKNNALAALYREPVQATSPVGSPRRK